MNKRAVAIRHVAFEDLGLLGPVLAGLNYDIDILDAGVDDLTLARDADLLIVLGGPIGAYEDDLYPFLHDELDLIDVRLRHPQPTLGICLGAQLIARAAGARVYPGREKEIGWAPVELSDDGAGSPLAAIADLSVLHWHGDVFDLPDEAVRLASTAITRNQAFAIDTHVLGLQFHLEVPGADFERWLIGHAVEIAKTESLSVHELRTDSAHHAPRLAEAAQQVFAGWLAGL
ncbi:glutamine amidotransferase [Govanella unica]|uniref:Glutamine amidotransferase n=1 Tax=Govanella unica TaxID=2975056 RepID=A0A9X3U0D1_9PROT|nr:glutamine amidotransferase [Govania unica]MDA5194843.1 glutamine amidotransferase [Govania unica]